MFTINPLQLLLIICSVCPITKSFSEVRDYGEKCLYTAECIDHRMVCQFDENILASKCNCDRFHKWGGEEIGCVQIYNISTILNMTGTVKAKIVSVFEDDSELEADRKWIFFSAILSAIFVITIGIICSLCVIVYCFHINKKDKKLRLIVGKLKNKTSNEEPPIANVSTSTVV